MTNAELISKIKLLYGETISDEEVSAFLDLATDEVIKCKYQMIGIPEEPDTSDEDSVKIMAVLIGLTQQGAEGQTGDTEGSFRRDYKYASMLDYIKAHVIPYAGFGR